MPDCAGSSAWNQAGAPTASRVRATGGTCSGRGAAESRAFHADCEALVAWCWSHTHAKEGACPQDLCEGQGQGMVCRACTLVHISYDDYFGLPYPLPKLDMIAIPEFAAGAMENWGLVTYREVDLLIGEGASRNQMQRVCIVVTHELAHQWFGNLVTMMWWDDLWLNEGFASWSEHYMADQIFPDFAMWDQFTSDTQAAAMRLDSLRSSHPIQVPIHAAEEVEEVFDAISYCKGASVIKMAHAYLGAEAFQKGLQKYMQKHKYSNTETNDLWAAWSEASGQPVNSLMASWTEQMGFPLVTVKSFTGSEMELEQTWFLADGSEVKPEEEKVWKIPLILSYGGQKTKPTLMEGKTQKIATPAADYVVINAGFLEYTPEMYAKLGASIGKLDVSDRAGLVLDSFALAKAGKLGADSVFRLIASFKQEKSYIVWDAISQVLPLGLRLVHVRLFV
eukprot:s1401_g7.t2